MKFERQTSVPRNNWKQRLEEVGMYYHTVENFPYWNENACYVLDAELVDKIEDATEELHRMCMEVVRDEIQRGDYRGYNFSDNTKFLIERSWDSVMRHIYGRFDLGIDDEGNLKMFEYNADTPTSLLEAAVVQWNWKEDLYPDRDQFNSIHEKLIEQWKLVDTNGKPIYFTTMKEGPYEDWGNVHYMMETAFLAGHKTVSIDLEDIGWNGIASFVDLQNNNIPYLFKLYPWEWLMNDSYAENVKTSHTVFFEPPWKMILSNKLLCVKLWNKFKGHPLLLEAYDMDDNLKPPFRNWLRKPKLGREGAGLVHSTQFKKGTIIQETFHVKKFKGELSTLEPVIGSWVIGSKSAGIGIREDVGFTTNNSQFVPHYFI